MALLAGVAAAFVLVRHLIDVRVRKLIEEAIGTPVPAVVPLMGSAPAKVRARRF